jgi:hypothetical protein
MGCRKLCHPYLSWDSVFPHSSGGTAAEPGSVAVRISSCDLPPALHDNTFPGEVFLHVAADALSWCAASRAEPVSLEGLREQFLPECALRGRRNKKLQYAVLAAAALHGGKAAFAVSQAGWLMARQQALATSLSCSPVSSIPPAASRPAGASPSS